LSHLHKGSPYADVAYFIFLALHRLEGARHAVEDQRFFLLKDLLNVGCKTVV